uniref:Uncharacterized protein n=2 Tax=Meloidogyne TaxID=189290 RepID=A0A6V7U0T5_MELEN|nr:unnamed protein product [Meloidogyne enterolobii]
MQIQRQHKNFPLELLVDIFKATDGAILVTLPICKKFLSSEQLMKFEKLWISCVNN